MGSMAEPEINVARNVAGLPQNCRADGASNRRKHRARALNYARWRRKVENGETQQKRGRGSTERRAERRRAAVDARSVDDPDWGLAADGGGGCDTAEEGDDDVWSWGLSWVEGSVDRESVNVQTQTTDWLFQDDADGHS